MDALVANQKSPRLVLPEIARALDRLHADGRIYALGEGWRIGRYDVPDAVYVLDTTPHRYRDGSGRWEFSLGRNYCGEPELVGAVTKCDDPRPLDDLIERLQSVTETPTEAEIAAAQAAKEKIDTERSHQLAKERLPAALAALKDAACAFGHPNGGSEGQRIRLERTARDYQRALAEEHRLREMKKKQRGAR
jgi:hypothetical protein